jgi:hypothetical protein
MQKFRISGAVAAMAMVWGGAAWAQAPGEFRAAVKLAEPAKAPAEAVVAGVTWRCGTEGCIGLASRYNTLDSVLRECRQVVAVVGRATAYASRGERLGRAGLAACNRAAANGRLLTAQN